MTELALLLVLIALTVAPLALIILGLCRRYTEKGILYFMIGCGIYAFAITGDLKPEALAITSWFAILFLCYVLFRWLAERKSKKYIEFLCYFLASIQEPSLPSCDQIFITKLTRSINSKHPSKLPIDVSRYVSLYVFEYAFCCLGSSDYRDCFTDLDMHGLQMLHICSQCNSYLLDQEYISEETFRNNELAINEQQAPLIWH